MPVCDIFFNMIEYMIMKLEDELKLSYYKDIAPLNNSGSVRLVFGSEQKRVFVKKELELYNSKVFFYLKEHPVKNMPKIIEVIEDEGRLVTIEEYISGTTLQEYIEQKGLLSEEETTDLAMQLCEIVRDLHSASPAIIHRDIKPSNIMISDDGVLKLLDLNAAKHTGGTGTKDTVLMGTEGYAAPEQYGFAPSDEKTDIYAIGTVMNICLTGELPGIKAAKGSLGRIIEKCTRMEPDERYENTGEILDALSKKTEKNSYAPPGFRSSKPQIIIPAAIGYAAVFAFCLKLDTSVENTFFLWLDRIFFLLSILAVIFAAGNYRGFLKKIGISKIKNPVLRIIAIIFMCCFILILGLLIPTMIESMVP